VNGQWEWMENCKQLRVIWLALFQDSRSFWLPRQCPWLCGKTLPQIQTQIRNPEPRAGVLIIPMDLSATHLASFTLCGYSCILPLGYTSWNLLHLPSSYFLCGFMRQHLIVLHTCVCMCVLAVCVCAWRLVVLLAAIVVASADDVVAFFTLLHFEDYCTMQFIFIVRF